MNKLNFLKTLLFIPTITLFGGFANKKENIKENKTKDRVTFYYTNKEKTKVKLELIVCEEQSKFWRQHVHEYDYLDGIKIEKYFGK